MEKTKKKQKKPDKRCLANPAKKMFLINSGLVIAI